MKFRSDKHRKAVFANIFNKKERRSRVNSVNVVNFEAKTTRVKEEANKKSERFGYERQIRLKDIEKTKEISQSCKMCKEKGLKLKSDICRQCEKEEKIFRKEYEELKRKEAKKREEERLKVGLPKDQEKLKLHPRLKDKLLEDYSGWLDLFEGGAVDGRFDDVEEEDMEDSKYFMKKAIDAVDMNKHPRVFIEKIHNLLDDVEGFYTDDNSWEFNEINTHLFGEYEVEHGEVKDGDQNPEGLVDDFESGRLY